jgi:hypothetical protein
MIKSFTRALVVATVFASLTFAFSSKAEAQTFSQRGFVDGRGQFFFEEDPTDQPRQIGDVMLRQEVFIKPSQWLRLFAGVDLRANSHDQVEDEWRLDFEDRGILRPKAAVRRLGATISGGHLTLDLGKQFIRWGRADILNPTDRFAPRDYLTVFDTEFLPVLGARAVVTAGSESFEGVWVPRFTPSRLPLIDQRWTVLPPEAEGQTIVDGGSIFPKRSQFGARWNHTASSFEGSLSFYDGFQNLASFDVRPVAPDTIEFQRFYPSLRSYGGDLAIPTQIVTLKGEAAYLRSPNHENDDYVLWVVELERQVGEWVFDGGYAGENTTNHLGAVRFAPDQGVAKSFIGRVSYTLGPRRSVAVEGAVRQAGDGEYARAEYSEAFGQHWRLTFSGVFLGGDESSFIGQYRHNSNASAALRFSY